MSEYTVAIEYAQAKAKQYCEKIKTFYTEKERCTAYNAYLQGALDTKYDNFILEFKIKQLEKELDKYRSDENCHTGKLIQSENTAVTYLTAVDDSDELFI